MPGCRRGSIATSATTSPMRPATMSSTSDTDVQEEVRNVARAVAQAVRELRAGSLSQPDEQLETPRQK